MSKIRLGFVGVGGMGQCAHLQNYATLPDCQVVAISELRPQLAAAVAARYGIPKVYADYRDMLAKESLDALVHINQFQYHGQTIPQLAQAGKPILTEKPIANSIETGEQILAAVKAAGTPYYVAYHKRSDPATIYAKDLMAQWLASGEFGRLRYVRLAMPPGDWIAAGFNAMIRTDETMPPSSADPCPASMQAHEFKYYFYLVNYYIHQINLLRHIMGDYEVTHADPAGVLLVARCTDGPNTGVTATIEMSTHSTSIAWQESAFIAFERGTISLELPAPLAHNRPGKVTVYRDAKDGKPETVIPELPWVHAMRQQAINFLKAVRGEPTPLATPLDAVKDLRAMKQYMDLFASAGGVVKSPW